MRKLALPDQLLLQVQKPARYLGNEIHAVYKDRKIPVRFAMCFPDVYEIGMSHLGIQILYELFNRRQDTWCERVFSPWTDMDRLLRDHHIPLFALESQDPVRDFDFLGFTLQFELCYTNILQVLDLSGIPLHAENRGEKDPIVIGGGPCACNPEPVARFFDLFYIGEGETSYDALIDLYRSMKERGEGREAFLRAAARIPGIYVPSLYEVTYGADGTIRSFGPADLHRADMCPGHVRRQVAADLDDPVRSPYPVNPLIPFLTVTQDRVAVELQRGCIRGCRFCQAGMIYRPNRERDLSTVQAFADAMLDSTGQDDILLSSLSSSDYSCIHEIVDYISDRREEDRVKLQVPSLRIDSFSLDLMSRVQDVRRSSLTFAPEAGSQRLRDVINKGITEEEILKGAREAFRGGWNKVKLYFMLGLPTETEEDRVAISDLANLISAAYYEEVPKEKRNGRCQITVSTSFFVPKPFTPFQWAPMYHAGDYLGFAATVNHAIYAAHNHRSIRYSWHDAQMIFLEGVLARGDRRVADLIEEAYRTGALFDCWLETWDYARWEQAADRIGMDLDFYAVRERKKEEILPWDFIDVGVRKDFLWHEWEKAQQAQLTPNCREACSGCGAAAYGCGVCLRQQEAEPPVPGGKDQYRTAEDQDPGNLQRPGEKDQYRTAEGQDPGNLQRPGEKDQYRIAESQDMGNLKGDPEKDLKAERECSAEDAAEKKEGEGTDRLCVRIRMRLAKYGPMKYIGHLELMRFLQKCLRRTDLDVHYSDGITPRMIMSTAMPLGLGLESSGEYVDIELGRPADTDHALEQLRPLMPEGLEILDFRQIGQAILEGGGTAKKPEKAMSVVAAADYRVGFRDSWNPPENWKELLTAFVDQEKIPWTKETKKGFRTLDMKPLIYAFSIGGKNVIGGMEGSAGRDETGGSEKLAGRDEFGGSEEFAGTGETGGSEELAVINEITGRQKQHGDTIRMCVCSRVGENLRPEQVIGECFRRQGITLPEDALEIFRLDLLAEKGPQGAEPGAGERTVSERFISLGQMGERVRRSGM